MCRSYQHPKYFELVDTFWEYLMFPMQFQVRFDDVDIGSRKQDCMMTPWNGNIFRITGLLCGEFTGHRLIPLTKASDGGFDIFFDLCLYKRLNKQSWNWWFETPSRS